METSFNRIYSEFTFHFASAYQRIVQFYLWCMSRAGNYKLRLSLNGYKQDVICRSSCGDMAAHGVPVSDASHHDGLLDFSHLRSQMDD